MEKKNWLKINAADLTDKTVVVTGATGTIGREIVKHLLTLNASVIMAVRNAKKAQSFMQELNTAFASPKVKVYELNVASVPSIEAFVAKIKKDKVNVNYLINNAGVFNLPMRVTQEFFEIHYATNYFGPVYLTLLMMPLLNKTEGAKAVFQSSMSYKTAEIDWNDIENLKQKNKAKLYGCTKRLLNLTIETLIRDLGKKYKNVDLVLCHPGMVGTDLIHYRNGGIPKIIYHIAHTFLKVVCHKPKTAALSAVMALSKDVPHGFQVAPRGLFEVWGKPTLRKLNRREFEEKEITLARHNLQNCLDSIESGIKLY